MPFSDDERSRLLAVPGVGPTVVRRLEELGIDSFGVLAAWKPDAICAAVAATLGNTCWRNSPRARSAVAGAVAAARAGLPADDDGDAAQ